MKDKYKMKNILRKLHLIENSKIELEISADKFIETMESHIDKSQSDFLDLFSRSKNNYKGLIFQNSFELKKRRRFSDSKPIYSIAYGTFEQVDKKLIINLEIKATNEDVLNLSIYGLIAFALLINCTLLF